MGPGRWRGAVVPGVLAALLAVAGCSASPAGGGRVPGPTAPLAKAPLSTISPWNDPAATTAAPAGATAPAGGTAPADASAAAITAARGPIVALGDSYTSGDLLPLSVSSPPLGCLRSTRDYAQRVAAALRAGPRLVNASCTSAGVADMTSPQATSLGTNPPQLNSLARGDALVMLTLGGDDLGFLRVLHECMRLSLTDPLGRPCQRHYSSGGSDRLAALVTAEGPKLAAVLRAIHGRAPGARVLLIGYPAMFPQQGGCWPVVPLTSGDITYLRGIERALNATLAAAAAATGTTFVDTYDATVGHDFCERGSVRDVEGLVPGTLTAPFHPNARGQAAMAAQVIATLRS